jgi:hypothetical protein
VFFPVGVHQYVIGEAGDFDAHASAGITSRAKSSSPDVS